MNNIPRELIGLIAHYVTSQYRILLCQVNKSIHQCCLDLTTKSCKKAIINCDIHSLIRLSKQPNFLNSRILRAFIMNSLVIYPDATIFTFLITKCKFILPHSLAYKIYLYKQKTLQNYQLATKCTEIILEQNNTGLRQIALYNNSTYNNIYYSANDAFNRKIDVVIASANGCIDTIKSLIKYDPKDIVALYMEIIQTAIANEEYAIIKEMLNFGNTTIYLSSFIIYLKRIYLICASKPNSIMCNYIIKDIQQLHKDLNPFDLFEFSDILFYENYEHLIKQYQFHGYNNLEHILYLLICFNDADLTLYNYLNSNECTDLVIKNALLYACKIGYTNSMFDIISFIQYKNIEVNDSMLLEICKLCLDHCDSTIIHKIILCFPRIKKNNDIKTYYNKAISSITNEYL